MLLIITSQEGVLFSGEIKNVQFPGVLGNFQVLNHHAPLVSLLADGSILYETDKDMDKIRVKSGILALNKGQLKVCLDA